MDQEEHLGNSRFLKAIEMLHAEAEKHEISLGYLVQILGSMGHSVLILVLCLFFLQPIPLPGISTPIGIIIIVLAILEFRGKPPWIPEKFRALKIPRTALLKTTEVAAKIWARVDRFLDPRLLFFVRSRFCRFISLVLVVLSSVFLALPLPIPFTNTIPALVIISTAFAQLEEDGLLILISYVCTVVMFVFFVSISESVYSYGQSLWSSSL